MGRFVAGGRGESLLQPSGGDIVNRAHRKAGNGDDPGLNVIGDVRLRSPQSGDEPPRNRGSERDFRVEMRWQPGFAQEAGGLGVDEKVQGGRRRGLGVVVHFVGC